MKIKKFIQESKNIEHDSYIWNMAGSMLTAFQSVIMLMILTRTVGLMEAGIFTIAYANANLFLTIGKYGMRNFQVSDARHQFSFREYINSRKITTMSMLLISGVYIIYAGISNSYTLEKSLVIIFMCIFKAADAVEDIYTGHYQQENRLDIGAKILTLRIVITILIFGIGIIVLHNLLLALVITTIITYILLFVLIRWANEILDDMTETCNNANIGKLLKQVFPLFANAFLSFYIGNAPKYSIDAMLNDELQACYGFIAMPVFVIGLLNGFIFNPVIYKMTQLWEKGQMRKFVKRLMLQAGIVIAITLVCLAGAYLLGVPILSLLYSTDLAPYKTELLILMLGGGCLGMSGLFTTAITIIRYQKCFVWIYGVVAVLAFLLSNPAVRSYGIMGASVIYTVLMGMLCICLGFVLIIRILRESKNKA